MTLILSLASPGGIYQSSDYRLTPCGDTHSTKVDDVAGAKQLNVSLLESGLVAQVCFTGVAQVGNVRTREWLSEILSRAAQQVDFDRAVSDIAARATGAMKVLPTDRRTLTIVIATVAPAKGLRLAVLSNVDQVHGPRRTVPLDVFETSFFVPTHPALFTFGCDVGVSHSDRKLLVRLVRSGSASKEIMDALAAVNRRAARNPKSMGVVSEGCWVTSLLSDGRTSTINFGQVAGIPDSYMGGMNVAEFIQTHFRPAPGKQLTIVQSASASNMGIGQSQRQVERPVPTPDTARQAPDLPAHPTVKIGRNDPCPCGSGKKYKKCHGFGGA